MKTTDFHREDDHSEEEENALNEGEKLSLIHILEFRSRRRKMNHICCNEWKGTLIYSFALVQNQISEVWKCLPINERRSCFDTLVNNENYDNEQIVENDHIKAVSDHNQSLGLTTVKVRDPKVGKKFTNKYNAGGYSFNHGKRSSAVFFRIASNISP